MLKLRDTVVNQTEGSNGISIYVHMELKCKNAELLRTSSRFWASFLAGNLFPPHF